MKLKWLVHSNLKEEDELRPVDGIARGVIWGILIWIMIILIIFLTSCATGAKKTAQEPFHAESGAGITIWKIPIVGIGAWGQDSWGSGAPSVIVHKYNYQAQPPALAPGAPPSLPDKAPGIVDYQTIYGSAWDDPTLVIFKNDSYRKIRIGIDGQRPIVLAPYGATADLHLGVGEHRARLIIEKPTAAHGAFEVIRFLPISIRPEGQAQIFHLYDY